MAASPSLNGSSGVASTACATRRVVCLAEQDLAGRRACLEPLADRDGVAGDEPVAAAAGSPATTSPVLIPIRTSSPAPKAGTGSSDASLAQLERGANGAQGVVLVHGRYAEDGHHLVADERLDRAAVALDRAAACSKKRDMTSRSDSGSSRPASSS